MARDNKLPYLTMTDKGHHTKIIDIIGDKYKCFNTATQEKILISKELLSFVLPQIVKEYEPKIIK